MSLFLDGSENCIDLPSGEGFLKINVNGVGSGALALFDANVISTCPEGIKTNDIAVYIEANGERFGPWKSLFFPSTFTMNSGRQLAVSGFVGEETRLRVRVDVADPTCYDLKFSIEAKDSCGNEAFTEGLAEVIVKAGNLAKKPTAISSIIGGSNIDEFTLSSSGSTANGASGLRYEWRLRNANTGQEFTEGLDYEFLNSTNATSANPQVRMKNPGGFQADLLVQTDEGQDSDNVAFALTFDDPETPDPQCAITNLRAGLQTECNSADNTYTQQVIVSYENPPAGNIVINGQIFPITSSPQTCELVSLTSDGQPVDVTANFSANTSCLSTRAGLFIAPEACNQATCSITDLAPGAQSSCQGEDNDYTQEVIVTYQNAPIDGDLVLLAGNIQQRFTIESSPQTVLMQGLRSDGQPVDVTAYFSADGDCERIETGLFTAPAGCKCVISSINIVDISPCDPLTNKYTMDVQVTFSNPPTGADARLVVNNQVFTVTGSPQIVTLTDLNSDGGAIHLSAYFNTEYACYIGNRNVGIAPASCYNAAIPNDPPAAGLTVTQEAEQYFYEVDAQSSTNGAGTDLATLINKTAITLRYRFLNGTSELYTVEINAADMVTTLSNWNVISEYESGAFAKDFFRSAESMAIIEGTGDKFKIDIRTYGFNSGFVKLINDNSVDLRISLTVRENEINSSVVDAEFSNYEAEGRHESIIGLDVDGEGNFLMTTNFKGVTLGVLDPVENKMYAEHIYGVPHHLDKPGIVPLNGANALGKDGQVIRTNYAKWWTAGPKVGGFREWFVADSDGYISRGAYDSSIGEWRVYRDILAPQGRSGYSGTVVAPDNLNRDQNGRPTLWHNYEEGRIRLLIYNGTSYDSYDLINEGVTDIFNLQWRQCADIITDQFGRLIIALSASASFGSHRRIVIYSPTGVDVGATAKAPSSWINVDITNPAHWTRSVVMDFSQESVSNINVGGLGIPAYSVGFGGNWPVIAYHSYNWYAALLNNGGETNTPSDWTEGPREIESPTSGQWGNLGTVQNNIYYTGKSNPTEIHEVNFSATTPTKGNTVYGRVTSGIQVDSDQFVIGSRYIK